MLLKQITNIDTNPITTTLLMRYKTLNVLNALHVDDVELGPEAREKLTEGYLDEQDNIIHTVADAEVTDINEALIALELYQLHSISFKKDENLEPSEKLLLNALKFLGAQ